MNGEIIYKPPNFNLGFFNQPRYIQFESSEQMDEFYVKFEENLQFVSKAVDLKKLRLII